MMTAAGFWPGTADAGAAEPGGASIVVRTYTNVGAEGAIGTARRTASGILERAGVAVAWLECGPRAEATDASSICTQPLRWNELVVRIVPAGTINDARHLNVLGVALVDLGAGGGSIATVYPDRVAVMAGGAGVDAAELMGRAMAHEIGHLLLGTNRHAARGLMRASWSSADLRQSPATQWLFRGHEGDVMRKGIAGRLRGVASGDE